MTDSSWRSMIDAPQDGSEVRLELTFPNGVPAYWDGDLKVWVLTRPLHIESIYAPDRWKPK